MGDNSFTVFFEELEYIYSSVFNFGKYVLRLLIKYEF